MGTSDLTLLVERMPAFEEKTGVSLTGNCVANYADHVSASIRVFADPDNARHTFEVCIYQDNQVACEELFAVGRKTLSVEDYMLKNKTDAAFQLLEKKGAELAAPDYIRQAVTWIRA